MEPVAGAIATAATSEDVRELAGFRSEHAGVVSVTVGLDPSRTPRDLDTRFNAILSTIEKRYMTPDQAAPVRKALRRDLDRLRRFWELEFDRDGSRGLAVFASSTDGLFRVLGLTEPVADHAVVDCAPSLVPLLDKVERHEGALVAVVGRERGEVYRLRGGRLVEVRDDTVEQHGKHRQGGWSQARYQRHIEKLVRDHVRDVDEELARRVRRLGSARLVFVAPEELRPEVASLLAPDAAAAVAGWVTAEAHADANDLLEVVRPVLDRALAIDRQEVVERWREDVAKGEQGAAGWRDTLAAASDARVGVLLLAENASAVARRCPRCGRASADPGACPVDGTSLEAHDGAELAVHLTLHRRGTVLVVPAESLGGHDVGALLRF